jgi:cytidylate kinase
MSEFAVSARTVLLISRGTMSGGRMIGECLAKHEGFQCVTREDLLAAVNRYGDIATQIANQIAKGAEAYAEFSELRSSYLILMRRALLEYACRGRLAYFGYSGHLLLERLRHFVRIRLIAPMELRIARTRQLLGYSEGEARAYIRRVDQERAGWARMMYGVDIRDPSLYDLCLNIERLSIPGACDLLRKTMQQDDFQPTPESIEQAGNYYLATQVLALLATDPRTARLELGGSVSGGILRLVGPYLPDADLGLVRSMAESVPGIGSVEYEAGYTPAFRYASGK